MSDDDSNETDIIDYDTFSYLMNNWVQSNFRSNVIPINLAEEDQESVSIVTNTRFQSPSIERLIQNACVGKFSESCNPRIQHIINKELYTILRIAEKVRTKRILSRIDIVNALKILGVNVPTSLG